MDLCTLWQCPPGLAALLFLAGCSPFKPCFPPALRRRAGQWGRAVSLLVCKHICLLSSGLLAPADTSVCMWWPPGWLAQACQRRPRSWSPSAARLGELHRDWGQGREGQGPGNGSQCHRAGLAGILGRNCSLAGWAGLAQGAQSSCGCPWIPGSGQGQAGHWGWSNLGQWEVSLPWQGWHWMRFSVSSHPTHSSIL